jgi:hypothetical protein
MAQITLQITNLKSGANYQNTILDVTQIKYIFFFGLFLGANHIRPYKERYHSHGYGTYATH